jgi:hypothetical protein
MGVPMMIRTSKACAGPAIERKPGVNALNDIDSHLRHEGEGGQIPEAKPKGPPPNLFSHRRRLENFFGVPIIHD